ncbi:hypothetical protein NG895_04540 [Aeoliella sp. ICT_H6.2]|uniref:ABC-2 family transporter protein n=1 Tax=Aeoliella straminimaris TaxID=2954799 RepID=A0A9X2F7B9_9BACT|nr:hypothetical protein [Aeoliella straminimaris]MCO6043164.1 hypothetical protein [Aeoliella straminimaris]
MSTIATPFLSPNPVPWQLIGRFVWKELRRMRGFVLGVAALAVLLMLFVKSVAQPADGEQLGIFLLLFPSFGGGAFVAIGAAITAYSVEREEQTDTFLHSLPRYPLTTFVSKLLAVLLLAIVFTIALAAVGWCVGGYKWLPAETFRRMLESGITLLVEATACGLLVSVLVPRPLLAAVLACAATSFSSQVAISIAGGMGYKGDDYYQAIPARLALAAAMLVLAGVLSRRWMLGTEQVSRNRKKRKTTTPATQVDVSTALSPAMAQQTLQPVDGATRRGIVWRLAWQTWRESWKAMLAVVVGGILMMAAVEALARSSGVKSMEQLPLSVFFIPGLCGAMAFRSDHRRGQWQFLAEHAGRPRLVWLVRVAGWALYLVLLWVPFVLVASWLTSSLALRGIEHLSQLEWNNAVAADVQVSAADLSYYLVLNFSLAAFAAFAVGQLTSQLIKSEILAAGMSLFGSIAILLFGYLIIAWRLPPVWCHLPVIVGCLLATYIRAPDWLAGRHTIPRWSGTVLAVVVPLLLVVISIPTIRGWQIDRAGEEFQRFERSLAQHYDMQVSPSGTSDVPFPPVHLASRVNEYEEQQRAAEELTRQYQQVLLDIHDSQPPSDNESDDSLGAEFGASSEMQAAEMGGMEMGGFAASASSFSQGGSFEGEFSGAEFAEGGFMAGEASGGDLGEGAFDGGEFGSGENDAEEAPAAVVGSPPVVTPEQIERLVELTKEPALRMGELDPWPVEVASLLSLDAHRQVENGDLDRAWDRLLALERLKSQILHNIDGQGRYLLYSLNVASIPEDKLLLDWALAPGQTSERLQQAAADLAAIHQDYPPLDQQVLVDYVASRRALAGGVLGWQPDDDLNLALFLDQLPGEHGRAEQALDLLATMSLAYIQRTSGLMGEELRKQLLVANGYRFLNDSVEANVRSNRQWQAANSSLLASQIWNSNVGLNYRLMESLSLRINLQLQCLRLALIAYHLDHGEYPLTLEQLVPDYLPTLPLDVYSGQAFQYAPRLLEESVWGEERWNEFARQHDLAPMIWSVGRGNEEAKRFNINLDRGMPFVETDSTSASESLPFIGHDGAVAMQFMDGSAVPPSKPRFEPALLKLPRNDEYPAE